MKPGNLMETLRCQIRRQTRDEDSIYAHRVRRCAIFYILAPLIGELAAKLTEGFHPTAPFGAPPLKGRQNCEERKES